MMLEIPRLPPWPKVGEKVGEYTLVERLRGGSQGALYRAERGGTFYILKFFHPDEGLRKWGVRELTLLAHMAGHPGVVRAIGHGFWPEKEGPFLFLVLEWVPGVDLWEYASQPEFSALRAARVVLGVARTLVDVHALNIRHGDIKPDNILIREGTEEPVLLDFGVGHMRGLPTIKGDVLPPGTRQYTSPEAWEFYVENMGKRVQYRPTEGDDLWALGVSLYAVLAQRWPFGSMVDMGVSAALRGEKFRPPHEVDSRVPRELSELCWRMLADDKAERYEDARALCLALAPLVVQGEKREAWNLPVGAAGPVQPSVPMEALVEGMSTLDVMRWEFREGLGHVPMPLLPQSEPSQPPSKALPPLPPPPPVAPVAAVRALPPAAPQQAPVAPAATPPSVTPRAQPRLALVVAVVALAVALAPLLGLRPLPPPQEAGSPARQQAPGHEVAHGVDSVEGELGAAPSEAPFPAPTSIAMKKPLPPSSPTATVGTDAREEPPRNKPAAPKLAKSSTLGAKATATAAVVSTLLDASCSTPTTSAVRTTTPATVECPKGALEKMRELELHVCTGSLMPRLEPGALVTVSPGPVVLHVEFKCGNLPNWTELRGKVMVMRPGQVEVHVSSVVTGDGELPVCMEAAYNYDSWLPLDGEGPGGTLKVWGSFDLWPVKSFATDNKRYEW